MGELRHEARERGREAGEETAATEPAADAPGVEQPVDTAPAAGGRAVENTAGTVAEDDLIIERSEDEEEPAADDPAQLNLF